MLLLSHCVFSQTQFWDVESLWLIFSSATWQATQIWGMSCGIVPFAVTLQQHCHLCRLFVCIWASVCGEEMCFQLDLAFAYCCVNFSESNPTCFPAGEELNLAFHRSTGNEGVRMASGHAF